MQDRATELFPSSRTGEDPGDGAYEHVRARVQALISAARDLSDTCADLADALRPLPGHVDVGGPDFGRLRAERTAALLDEAASAARGTLGLLHSAYSALERQLGRPPVQEPAPVPGSGVSTWPDAFVELPRRAFTVEDEAGTAPAVRRAASAADAWPGGHRDEAEVRTGVRAGTADGGPDPGGESLRESGAPDGGEASHGLDEPRAGEPRGAPAESDSRELHSVVGQHGIDEAPRGLDEPSRTVDEPGVDEPRHAVGDVDGSGPGGVEQSEVGDYGVGEAPRETDDYGLGQAPRETDDYGLGQAPRETDDYGLGQAPRETDDYGLGQAPRETDDYGLGQAPRETDDYGLGQAPRETDDYGLGQAPRETDDYGLGQAPREIDELDGDRHTVAEPAGRGTAGVDEPGHGGAELDGGEPRGALAETDNSGPRGALAETDNSEPRGALAETDNSEPRGRPQDDGVWRSDADLGAAYPDGVDPAASWDPAEREAVTTAALAGWVAVDPDDEDAGGRPILDRDHDHDHEHDHHHDHEHDHEHDREPAPEHAREPDREPDLPWRPADRDDDRPARTIAAEHIPSPVLTLPVDPHSGDGPGWHGDTVSPEPRSLSLVPPVPEPDPGPGPAGYPDPAPWRDEASPPMPAPDAEPWATEPRSTWQPVPGLAARPVWAAEVVPGASAAGDGQPVYPLDTVDVPTDDAGADADVPLGQAAPLPPTGPLDDPGGAVIARQVEAARRHLQAALVVANQPAAAPRLGALLTAVERVLTAVTDLARETRGVLESGLVERTFPGEARFLCSQPWERVELVGRDAYGDDVASPAGLAKLLRSLGYEATSVTSAGGIAGVQVRSERYALHVALVEPAGGGRQRWSGALEWTDPAGAPRTWAETLGPVELEDEELARRVDELVRRCVGATH